MADVRLTATNPEDSSVVPVACNEKGELKLEEPLAFDGTLDNDLTVSGKATITDRLRGPEAWSSQNDGTGGYDINSTGTFFLKRDSALSSGWLRVFNSNAAYGSNSEPTILMDTDGTAEFSGEVIIFSRGSKWTIVEQSGLAHLIQVPSATVDVDDDPSKVTQPISERTTPLGNDVRPKLRDIPGELDMIESALHEVMDKLKMTPPAGWEVWDGSD